MTDRTRVDLLGVPLDPRTKNESVASLVRLLEWPGECAHVVTLNPEYVMAARRDRAFLAALKRADLVLADGAGVVAAARAVGIGGVERLTGIEIVERLAERGTRLFLLGAGPGVAETARLKLSVRFATAKISGCWAGGSPKPSDDEESIRRIVASGAESVAVAYGAEGQVLWIDRNRDRLTQAGVRLAVGVGGAFDYLSGLTVRPPEIVRRTGMEWLWRLAREPWRWRRQLALPRFAFLVFRAWIRSGSKR